MARRRQAPHDTTAADNQLQPDLRAIEAIIEELQRDREKALWLFRGYCKPYPTLPPSLTPEVRQELTDALEKRVKVKECRQHMRYLARSDFWRWDVLYTWAVLGEIACTSKKFLFQLRDLEALCDGPQEALRVLVEEQKTRKEGQLEGRQMSDTSEWVLNDLTRAKARLKEDHERRRKMQREETRGETPGGEARAEDEGQHRPEDREEETIGVRARDGLHGEEHREQQSLGRSARRLQRESDEQQAQTDGSPEIELGRRATPGTPSRRSDVDDSLQSSEPSTSGPASALSHLHSPMSDSDSDSALAQGRAPLKLMLLPSLRREQQQEQQNNTRRHQHYDDDDPFFLPLSEGNEPPTFEPPTFESPLSGQDLPPENETSLNAMSKRSNPDDPTSASSHKRTRASPEPLLHRAAITALLEAVQKPNTTAGGLASVQEHANAIRERPQLQSYVALITPAETGVDVDTAAASILLHLDRRARKIAILCFQPSPELVTPIVEAADHAADDADANTDAAQPLQRDETVVRSTGNVHLDCALLVKRALQLLAPAGLPPSPVQPSTSHRTARAAMWACLFRAMDVSNPDLGRAPEPASKDFVAAIEDEAEAVASRTAVTPPPQNPSAVKPGANDNADLASLRETSQRLTNTIARNRVEASVIEACKDETHQALHILGAMGRDENDKRQKSLESTISKSKRAAERCRTALATRDASSADDAGNEDDDDDDDDRTLLAHYEKRIKAAEADLTRLKAVYDRRRLICDCLQGALQQLWSKAREREQRAKDVREITMSHLRQALSSLEGMNT